MDNALATAAAAAAAALRLNQSLALTPGGYILQPTTQTTENAQLLLQLPQARIQPPGLLPPSAGSTFHFARILGAAGSQQQPVAASHAAASRLGTSTHGNGSTRTRQSGWDVLPKPQQQQQHSSQGTRGVEGEGGRGSLWDQQQQPPHRGFGMLEVSVNPSLSGHPDSSTQGYGTTESGDSKIVRACWLLGRGRVGSGAGWFLVGSSTALERPAAAKALLSFVPPFSLTDMCDMLSVFLSCLRAHCSRLTKQQVRLGVIPSGYLTVVRLAVCVSAAGAAGKRPHRLTARVPLLICSLVPLLCLLVLCLHSSPH